MGTRKNHSPNCLECHHYYVTWDVDHPKGCRAFGMKTRELPSFVVQKNSGLPCQSFQKKKPRDIQPSSAAFPDLRSDRFIKSRS